MENTIKYSVNLELTREQAIAFLATFNDTTNLDYSVRQMIKETKLLQDLGNIGYGAVDDIFPFPAWSKLYHQLEENRE